MGVREGKMIWKPIETAPMGEFVLAVGNDGVVIIVRLMRDDDVSLAAYWSDDKYGYYHLDAFTHWMPLPAPPLREKLSVEPIPPDPYVDPWREK
jgi:hypothetical protein